MIPQGEPATVIVASSTDLASRTLGGALVGDHGFSSTGVSFKGTPIYQRGSLLLVFFEGLIVSPPDLDEFFNPQGYIFLSRHSAESGIPSLTAHTTGNFGEARFGGNPGEMGICDPSFLKGYMVALQSRREEVGKYKVSLEATHHGPTSLRRPVTFVELGSSSEFWGDRKAASVVGAALVESLEKRRIWTDVVLAFGGTHYPEKFTRMEIEQETAVSFIVPKHSLGHLDERMFGQMIQRTSAPVSRVIVDWKGLGQEKSKVLALASQFGLEVVRV